MRETTRCGPLARSAGRMAIAGLAAACATTGPGPGGVDLFPPGPAHGDETAIVWPFTVRSAGGTAITGFRLQVVEGATLLGVRPDPENPDPGAPVAWTGAVEEDVARWSGDPLPVGRAVALTLLLRPDGADDPRLRVRHAPLAGGDEGPETCETWRYDVERERIERDAC